MSVSRPFRPRLSVSIDVVWSERALSELVELVSWIKVQRPTAAERILTKLRARAQSLSQHPRMGPRRPEIGPRVRWLVEKPYLILYRTVPDDDDQEVVSVEIVSLVDGRRDLTRLYPGPNGAGC